MSKLFTVICLSVCFFAIVIAQHRPRFRLSDDDRIRSLPPPELRVASSNRRPTIAGRTMRTNLRSSGPQSRIRGGVNRPQVSRAYNPLVEATVRYNSRARSPALDKDRQSAARPNTYQSAAPVPQQPPVAQQPPRLEQPVEDQEPAVMSVYEQVSQQQQEEQQGPRYESYGGGPSQAARNPSSGYGYAEERPQANEGEAYGAAPARPGQEENLPIRSGRYGQQQSERPTPNFRAYNRQPPPPQSQQLSLAALYGGSQSGQNSNPYGQAQQQSAPNGYGQALSNPYGQNEEVTEVKKLIIQDVDNDSYVSLQQLCDTEIEREIEREWQKYVQKFFRVYPTPEDEQRARNKFRVNYLEMKRNNKLVMDEGKRGADMGMNDFSDLGTDEFIGLFTGFKPSSKDQFRPNERPYQPANMDMSSLPVSVDWTARGMVTPVKDQSKPQLCNACWAFASVGALESAYAIHRKKNVLLSEQELVDCSKGALRNSNNGCDNGFIDASYEYMLENGVEDAGTYPYVADEEVCVQNQQYKAAELVDYRVINGSEDLMKHAVATMGPIAAYIEIKDAKSYAGQVRPVFFSEDCQRTKYQDLDHAVVITGYGTTDDGLDYWIIKNSWGDEWGRQGYMWLTRGENHCGIAFNAFVPVVNLPESKKDTTPKNGRKSPANKYKNRGSTGLNNDYRRRA